MQEFTEFMLEENLGVTKEQAEATEWGMVQGSVGSLALPTMSKGRIELRTLVRVVSR